MKAKITYLCILLILSGLATIRAKCQDYGFHGSLNLNRQEADIRQIGFGPDSIPKILAGSNPGFSLGLFYDLKLPGKLSLRFYGQYTNNNISLTKDIKSTLNYKNRDTSVIINYLLNSVLSAFEIIPELRLNLIERFVLSGGISIGYRLSKKYELSENIKEPAIFFPDGSNNRTNIYNYKTFSLESSIMLGLSYFGYIDKYNKYFLSPEVKLVFGFAKLNSGFNVDITSIRIGISFGMNPNIKYPQLKEPDIKEPDKTIALNRIIAKTDTTELNKKNVAKNMSDSIAKLNLKINIVRNNQEYNSNSLTVRQTISSNILPVLNYIFFDKNSNKLSRRYIQLEPWETKSFSISRLHNLPVLNKYRHILNIIGYRMHQNDNAVISLTGCNSGEDEANDLNLSEQRCLATKEYLINRWNIKSERISCKSRNLPLKYSGLKDSLSLEENRRVEITSDDSDILALLSTTDTLFTADESVRIRISNNQNIEGNWELIISNDNRIIKLFNGNNNIPKLIEWIPEQSEINNINSDYPIVLSFIYKDSSKNLNKAEGNIVLKFDKSVRNNIISEENFQNENYSLILFDFNSSELTSQHQQIVEYLKTRLRPESRIIIEGLTDLIGDSTYNINLSTERAINTYKALKIQNNKMDITFLGMGYTAIYDNNLPEGRLYSRTVIIRVINPKKPEQK